MGNGQPTMRDVAKEAGVSVSLVSLVIRDETGVKASTRRHVLEIARQMGYVRDENASTLRVRHPTTIGVCVHVGDVGAERILDTIQREAASDGHQLFLSAVTPSRAESDAVENAITRRCGALILVGSRCGRDVLSACAEVPTISVAGAQPPTGVDWVAPDDEGGVGKALDLLQDLGHRSVLVVSCVAAAGGVELRAATSMAGRMHPRIHLRTWDAHTDSHASGYEALDAVWGSGDRSTAVITHSDTLAVGLMDAAIRRGVSVPDAFSLIAIGGAHAALRPDLDLTRLGPNPDVMAQQALRRAIERLTPVAADSPARGLIVPMHLHIGGTTASPTDHHDQSPLTHA